MCERWWATWWRRGRRLPGKNVDSSYTILETDRSASDEELKKAYRRMAIKYHPDKVHHLGPEYSKDAQEKFKKINEAYERIKKERGII